MTVLAPFAIVALFCAGGLSSPSCRRSRNRETRHPSTRPLWVVQPSRCCSLILAEGCSTDIWCGLIGKPPTSYCGVCGVCWAVAALVPLSMTTAAVKATAVTIKICFFDDRPRFGSEFSIFNMERAGPTRNIRRHSSIMIGAKARVHAAS